MSERRRFLERFPSHEAPGAPPKVPAWAGDPDPETFAARLREAGGEAWMGGEDWVEQVVLAARSWGAETAVATGEPGLAPAVAGLQRAGITILEGVGGEPARAAEADLGLTMARFGLASTGTVVLESSPLAPRAVSLLPEAHLAVLPAEAILPDLAALAGIAGRRAELPSALTLVTGPSRTADIEQTLVIGAHGPRRMGVVVVAD